MIPRSMELASKEGGNYNNVTSGEFLKRKLRAEKSQSGSYVITIIQDFTLVSLTPSVTPHPTGLPLGAAIPSLLRTRLPTHLSPYALISLHTCLSTYSSPYALVFLRTCLPTHSSPYALVLPLRLCTSQKNILLKYLSKIVHLSRCHL